MQHVYGHSGSLGDECADHAAALGTLGSTPKPQRYHSCTDNRAIIGIRPNVSSTDAGRKETVRLFFQQRSAKHEVEGPEVWKRDNCNFTQ